MTSRLEDDGTFIELFIDMMNGDTGDDGTRFQHSMMHLHSIKAFPTKGRQQCGVYVEDAAFEVSDDKGWY